jgi:hypothetical protein
MIATKTLRRFPEEILARYGIDALHLDDFPWSAFRFDEGAIRIQATEFYRPKSHDSEGDVLVDPELLEIFRGYYARRKSALSSNRRVSRILPRSITNTGSA